MSRDVVYADHKRMVDRMPIDPAWVPGALRMHAMGEITRAGRLTEAAESIRASYHTSQTMLPGELTDQQYAQRRAILEIAVKIVEADRDRAMDEAMAFWSEYRKRSA